MYLKVKLRKEGSVSRSDYSDVRNRIQDVRSKRAAQSPSSADSRWMAHRTAIQTGTSIATREQFRRVTSDGSRGSQNGPGHDVADECTGHAVRSRRARRSTCGSRTELSSETAQVEQRFEATTVADLYRGNQVLIPAGSTLRGVVSSVNKATRTDRKGSLTVAFDQITFAAAAIRCAAP